MLPCPGSLPCLGCGHAVRRVGGSAGWACRGILLGMGGNTVQGWHQQPACLLSLEHYLDQVGCSLDTLSKLYTTIMTMNTKHF